MTEISPLVHVVGVTVIGDHELRLLFEDGTVGDIAFGDDEWRGVFAPLRDPELFAQVCVDPQAGTIARGFVKQPPRKALARRVVAVL